MAKYGTLILIVLLFVAGIATYKYSINTSVLTPPEEEAKQPSLDKFDFQKWHEFSAPQGKFKVLLPSLPQHAIEKVNGKNGEGNKKYEMFVSEKNDGTIFMINLITFEDTEKLKDHEKLLRAMMNDMVGADPKNELKRVSTGKFKEFNALNYSFANPATHVDAKSFVIDDTVYMLTRVTKTQNYTPDEFNFFVNSFDIPNASQKTE